MIEEKYRLSTVKQVLEYYMENRGFMTESWKDMANLTKVFIDVMGRKKLKDLQPEHFNAYCTGRRRGAFGKRKAKKTGTLRRELIHLVTAINFCAKSKLVNPEHIPFIPLPEKSPPRERWLTKEEIQRIKNEMRPGSRAETFIKIVLATGARRRSIETLEWDQVNFETNTINFNKPGASQTKKRKPVVPIQSDLRLFLEQKKKTATNAYVLGEDSQIVKSLQAVCKRAKVQGVTPHVFRHTFASHASMNGVSMGDIARILGDTISTVEKVYAKFQPDYLQTAIERASL